jgi:hypothetical protein
VQFLVTVAVLAYVGPGGAPASEAARALADAARATGAEVIVDGAEAAVRAHAQGWVDASALAFFARGAALVADGRKALARVELAAAEEKLAAAEAVYAPELARPGAAGEAATAALWRGVALFELARRGDAERAFRRALALEPATTLTEAQVRPEVARAFAHQRLARAKARLTLQLKDLPPEVTLRLDTQPLEVAGDALQLSVEAGEHLLLATAPRALPQARLIDVPPAGLELALTLEPDRDAAALAMLREAPTEAGLTALFSALRVDEALIVAGGRDLGAPVLVAQRAQHECATATVIAPRADELLRRADAAACRPGTAIDLLRAPPLTHPRPAPSLTERHGPPPPARAPLWRKPWLWVGVVGAVGVGVVIVANVVPRAASFTGTLSFREFALSAR